MSVNAKIEAALNECCSNIWPVVCPDAHPPEEYIVYNPELETRKSTEMMRIWNGHIICRYIFYKEKLYFKT